MSTRLVHIASRQRTMSKRDVAFAVFIALIVLVAITTLGAAVEQLAVR